MQMVPPQALALDDVFVIWLFGVRRLRWSKFVPWSALCQHCKATSNRPERPSTSTFAERHHHDRHP